MSQEWSDFVIESDYIQIRLFIELLYIKLKYSDDINKLISYLYQIKFELLVWNSGLKELPALK